MARVAVIIQPLEALYQVRLGRGLTPPVEAMLRIAPRFLAFMAGTISRAVRKTDLALIAKMRSKTSSGSVSSGWGDVADAGIVHQDVDIAERLGDRFDQRLHLCAARNVGAHGQAADVARQPVRRLAIEIRDDDIGAFASEAAHNTFAEAGGAAGNDRDSILQAHPEILSMKGGHGLEAGESVKRLEAFFAAMARTAGAAEW